MTTYADYPQRARRLLRDPVAWTELIQLLKTVVAAVVAWTVAARGFGLPQAFLAPWSAMLVVHATVYRSFWTGAKQVTGTVVGVILAWAVGNTLGLDPVSLAVMLLAGLVIGQIPWLRDEATTAAATALFVLTTGFATSDHILIGRLYDTAIGVGVGVVVNLLVWPPLQDVTAARAIETVSRRVGALLRAMGDECRDDCQAEHVETWVSRSQELDGEVDGAWALVRQARESERLNPRPRLARGRRTAQFGESLDRIEQALAEIRSMARTVEHSIVDTKEWEREFRDRWTGMLCEVGSAIEDNDTKRLGQARATLGSLATDYSREDLSALHWTEYGSLIMNLRNVATSMDHVAAFDPFAASSEGEFDPAAL